jgi:transposase-like protein
VTERRRYTKREKVTAVIAAEASSQEAAAEAHGIPRTTLRYWMNDPELAELRQKAREELSEGAAIAAHMAWAGLIRAMQEGRLEPRDLITAAGVATDKAQLLAGHATARTENRTLTDGLDDHEKRILRDILDRATTELAEAAARVDPVGAGAEVRE